MQNIICDSLKLSQVSLSFWFMKISTNYILNIINQYLNTMPGCKYHSKSCYFLSNNIHEKIYPFWLVKNSAVFFKTVQKRVNSVQKEETNQAFWLVNDQSNSQMANQIFCFQIKRNWWRNFSLIAWYACIPSA